MSDNLKKNPFTDVPIETRVIACCGSINFREIKHSDLPSTLCDLEKKLQSLNCVENYYLISHDDTETPHIHYVIEFRGAVRLKTMLNNFEKLGYNREAVNCKKLGFLNCMIKYFLHQTELSIEDGKKEYSINQIISNMPFEYIQTLETLDDDSMSYDKLESVCLECDGFYPKIMRMLGLQTFHKWRYEIGLILNYSYALRMARDKERERRKQELLDSLPF